MAHVNQQIREAAETRLAAVPALATVYTSRSANLIEADLPAAVIGTGLDEVVGSTKDGREVRTVTLTVVLVANAEQDALDDTLDALRVAVETALADDLGGLATNMHHTGAELELGTDEDGERWFAFYALGWVLQVFTQVGDPETML